MLVFAGLLAYSNSFTGPFLFDDSYVTTSNPTIRQLWPLSVPLSPPADSTSGGRPIFNLSFAINYALGGYDTVGYHVGNLLIHFLAGLTLFGVVRRTLVLVGTRVPSRPVPSTDGRGLPALPLAFAVALLWLLHPVQTEAVTYISQRAESLMSLFYLLTLYVFIRAAETKSPKTFWSVLCVLACLLGMATKEVMVTAPIIVLLYDRTFLAGTFREAWRLRWKLHAGLMSTWFLLGWLLLDIRQREVGVGYGVSCWQYALTECKALVIYLGLVIWPYPLVIDYGTNMVTDPWSVLPQALLIFALLTVTIWALFRRPMLGFAGAWFWIILAPTSSFLPLPLSPIGTHRIYLALAALLTLFVLGLYRWLGKNSFWIAGLLALVWGGLTFQRNFDYSSSLSLWQQTVAHAPDNPRAHNNCGEFLIMAGQPEAAIVELQEALRLKPDYPEAQNNWGFALAQLGHPAEAVAHYQESIRLKPNYDEPHNNFGLVLMDAGRFPEAIEQFKTTLQINPLCAEAQNNWGNALLKQGKPAEALEHYEEALRLNPVWYDVHLNWALALEKLGRKAEALEQYELVPASNAHFDIASANIARLSQP